MSSDLLILFKVEGIGFDTSFETAAEWTYRRDPNSGHGLRALASVPQTISTIVDPLTGDISLSPMNPTFHYGPQDADADKQAATTFLDRGRRIGELATDINATTTDIPFDDGGAREDQVVHINSEAVLLGTYRSDVDGNGNGGYDECTRDMWRLPVGQGAKSHRADDPVWDGPPYWQGRVVNLQVARDGAAPETRWAGIIRNAETSSDGTKLTLRCDNFYSTVLETDLYRKADPIEASWEWREAGGDVYLQFPDSVIGEDGDYKSQVHKPATWGEPSERNRAIAVQAGEALFVQTDNKLIKESAPLANSSVDVDESRPLDDDEPVWELALYGQRIEQIIQDEFGPLAFRGDPLFDADDADRHHPARIFEAHFVSTIDPGDGAVDTGDVLRGEWGMSLDLQNVGDIVADTDWLAVDHYVLGWGGEPVPMSKLIRDLLRNYGLLLALDQTGQASVKRYTAPTVEDLGDAPDLRAIPKTLDWDAGYDRAVTEIAPKIGDLPWQEPRPVRIETVRHPAPDWHDGERWEWAYPTVARDNVGKIQGKLIGQIKKFEGGYPRFRVRVDDPANLDGVSRWEIGDWVLIDELPSEAPWAVDADGVRARPDGSDAWLALIVGTKYQVAPGDGQDSWELTLIWRFSEVVRWRAPSMEVDSANTGGNNDRAYCVSASQFGFGDSDNRSFDVGDDIQVYARSGAEDHVTVYEIADIGSDGSGEYLQIGGTWDQDPTGQFIRLADFDSYDNPDTAISGVTRPWIALADAAGTLGSGNDDEDQYGL